MNFLYNNAKYLLITGDLNLFTSDLRVLLVMTNSTTDIERDAETISDFTTLDEGNGTNYSRQSLTNKTVTIHPTNNTVKLDATDTVFTNLGPGSRNYAAAVLYKHITNDTDSVPIAYFDESGFPFTGIGSSVMLRWNTEGVLKFSDNI